MIYDGTRLVVTDNSGAKEVECIKTRGAYATIGDIITCSVKKAGRGKVTAVRGRSRGGRGGGGGGGAAGAAPHSLGRGAHARGVARSGWLRAGRLAGRR